MTDLDFAAHPMDQGVDPEAYVLGAMMMSRDATLDVLDLGLREDHFYRPAHGEVFEALTEAFARVNGPVDPVVLAAELERRGTLLRVGGAPYLHTLMSTPFVTVNAGYYAEQVMQRHVVRGVYAAGLRLQQLGENAAAGADVHETLDRARAHLDVLADTGRRSDTREFDRVVDDWLANLGQAKTPPLSTGIQDLDELLGGGFRPGQLVLVAARPGVGKTVVGTNFGVAAAQRGYGAAICSMEMTSDELMERIFADQANIPLDRIREPFRMDDDDRRKLGLASDRIAAMPLKIVDDGEQTLSSIRAVARERSRTERGLRLLAVDYIQLMTSTSRAVNRSEVVGEFSRGLKLIAKEFDITVVGMCQLNRGSEQRADKRPGLTDLRESGNLEQDADIVILLHREPDNEETMDDIEFRIAKHRGGPTGARDLLWSGPYQRVTGRTPALRVVR